MKHVFPSLLMIAFFCFIGSAPIHAQDYKVKQVTTIQGQRITNTIYVKGSRKRTESSGMMGTGKDAADIEQCDLRQNVKLNNKKKLYFVEPFATGDSGPTTKAPTTTAKPKSVPTTKGGSVTYVNNITDTGERKEMFGMTARRVKTTMSIEASPDACSKQDMKMETDGWYIDLPAFSCPIRMTEAMLVTQQPTERGGCQDTIHTRNTGSGKIGFPLSETRTMSAGEAGMGFTTTTETLEFSKATLEQALFDIPQGYALAEKADDLTGRPSLSDMREYQKEQQAQNAAAATETSSSSTPARPAGAKAPGVTRIGVLVPTNKGEAVSTSNLQSFLIQQLTQGKIEAVAIASEADAKTSDCDYVLSNDFTKLKPASMGLMGGVMGKITGMSPPYDAQVEYKLVQVATGKVTLAKKEGGKMGTDAYTSAQNVLLIESQAVLTAVGKN